MFVPALASAWHITDACRCRIRKWNRTKGIILLTPYNSAGETYVHVSSDTTHASGVLCLCIIMMVMQVHSVIDEINWCCWISGWKLYNCRICYWLS